MEGRAGLEGGIELSPAVREKSDVCGPAYLVHCVPGGIGIGVKKGRKIGFEAVGAPGESPGTIAESGITRGEGVERQVFAAFAAFLRC